MANTLDKIRLSGVTYDIVDASAVHSLEGYATTNEVTSAITAASASILETVGEAGYQTSGDVQSAISGKADASAVVTAIVENPVQNSAGFKYTKNGSDTSVEVVHIPANSGLTFDKTNKNLTVDFTQVAAKTDIPSVSGYADSVKYNTSSKYMEFYNGGTGGTKVFEFDAAPFLIDGMVENVEIKDVTLSGESVTCLVITFNTDAGKQEIDIPLTEIFDASNYYTTAQTDSAIEAATSGKVDTTAYTAYTAATDAALSGKQDTLVSQTNIKSINGESLLGSGNITIEQGTVDQTVISGSANAVAGGAVYDELQGKQATLVSGTNIKTVGTESILGSGNVKLMTAHVGTGNDATTLIFEFN